MPPVNVNSDFFFRPGDRRAARLERSLETAFPSANSGIAATADPYSANTSHKLAIDTSPFIVFGRIVGGGGYTRNYKVQLDGFGGVINCSDMAYSSYSVFGVRQINTYVPGTAVWVLWPPMSMYGIILGAIPDWMVAPRDALSDSIVQGSNVGLTADQVHNYPFELNLNGGITDWSSGQPFDSIPIGDYGCVSDTGNMLLVDSMMAMLRVDEETGLYLFYDDQLARLAGHNLQIWAAGYERQAKDDGNEFDDEQGFTDNAFREGTGLWDDTTQQYRQYTAQQAQQDTPYYSALEPAVDDQQSIYRYRIFRGYLGQGEKRALFIPPDNAAGVERYQNLSKYPCVAQEFWAKDGAILLETAKAMVIGRRALRTSPKRIRMPEDPNGDSPSNYKACGIYGSGVPHKIGDFSPPPANDNLVKLAAFQDFYTKLAVHDSNIGMRYHKLEWYVPDEADYAEASQMIAGIPNTATLRMQQYLPSPTPLTLRVDDRYGMVKYYPNDSYLAFSEDGGIELCDGYGAELRMSAGSIFLSAPGDIHIMSGKDSYVLAGRHFTARSNEHTSISSNWRDVRIKAEQNVLVVGGNDSCGGVLIESKAPKTAYQVQASDEVITGIVLRAKEAPIVAYGQQIDLILSDNGSGSPTETRSIILDAGTGGTINTRSQYFFRHVTKAVQDDLNGTVNEFAATYAIIGSDINIYGKCFVNGCLDTNGNITSNSAVVGNTFNYITGTGIGQISTNVTNLTNRKNTLLSWATSSMSDVTLLQSTTDVLKVQFFFKSSADLGTTNFILFENRWQQIARVANTVVDAWTENPVLPETAFPGLQTYPPPGKAAWKDSNSYLQQNLNLFQLGANLSQPWGSAYENPTYATPATTPLDGNFTIIKNPS